MTDTTDPTATDLEKTLGIEFVRVSQTEVVAELEVGQRHVQAFGAVHGGVYCCLIESAASRGALEVTRDRGLAPPFGVENSTSFVRAAREGRIRVTATPISRGSLTQVWDATVRDADGKVLATGRVRLLSVPEAKRPAG
jgi:uncharacterized protein (TIGR00369 family)